VVGRKPMKIMGRQILCGQDEEESKWALRFPVFKRVNFLSNTYHSWQQTKSRIMCSITLGIAGDGLTRGEPRYKRQLAGFAGRFFVPPGLD